MSAVLKAPLPSSMSNLRNLPPGEVATAFISASSSCSLSFPLWVDADEGTSGSWVELGPEESWPTAAQDEAAPGCWALLGKTESEERSSSSTLFLKKRFSLLSRFWPVSTGFSEESSVPVGSPESVAMGNGLSHTSLTSFSSKPLLLRQSPSLSLSVVTHSLLRARQVVLPVLQLCYEDMRTEASGVPRPACPPGVMRLLQGESTCSHLILSERASGNHCDAFAG
ncbi:hypothetical protein EYF80_006774 [Liparis tanakae]|uniref:Uncharacterized protein n=1 Tax=Liparis tanakae TaxID=230148 RepID=A0A4Z2IYH2_9TELE|nr:hypothetical protein EYF80_006774 [Liparis tanakae]